MAGTDSEPVGTLATALAHASRLLAAKPALAEAQAREILKVIPGQKDATLLLAAARRGQGDAAGARRVLADLLASHSRFATAHREMAFVAMELGDGKASVEHLRLAVALDSALGSSWLVLADRLALSGDTNAADTAYAEHIRSSVNDPQLLAAANALCENRIAVAERLLRAYLKEKPTDVAAIRMLAEAGARLGRYQDAELLLARCLELAPSFATARHNYATVLYRQHKSEEALNEIDKLLSLDPKNPNFLYLKAAALGRIGDYAQAVALYEDILKAVPNQPSSWMSYGHALKAIGRQADSIAAYRTSIAQRPGLGEAWWSLANLKTFRFSDAEIATMQRQLQSADISDDDRLHLHFSLGKALEDKGDYGASFENYAQGNCLRRAGAHYDPEETTAHLNRSTALFTREFFVARAGVGCAAADPIFVVGLPRSGSTLVEQILSSHSAIEGTMELPDITAIARRLGGRKRKDQESAYPEVLADLPPADFEALGQEYLDRTRIQRKLGRPFFIDKMPNNFTHMGLIHLILPNARIVDARRHPLGCCFSGYKQHFARGQNFTYDLTEIGRYYADYVELMAHFDRVLPGRVHRVFYERMVADTQGEVRRLLDYCGVPFEQACLRFYENDRAVNTASSEQVRAPIFTDAVEQWRNYEPWLQPLKSALDRVLDDYPATPEF